MKKDGRSVKSPFEIETNVGSLNNLKMNHISNINTTPNIVLFISVSDRLCSSDNESARKIVIKMKKNSSRFLAITLDFEGKDLNVDFVIDICLKTSIFDYSYC